MDKNFFKLKNIKTLVLVIIFCITIWLLFSYKITDVPPSINGDEIAIGYNAMLISQSLHDENNRLLPLFISTSQNADWKQPITMYTTALAFKIFGPSYPLLRQVSVIFILISTLLLFYLLKNIADTKLAVIGVIIFTTIPAVMIQSHLALENIAPIPFVVLWLIFLSKYEKTLKLKFIILSGISLGISIYAYQAMRLMVPVFGFLSILFILFVNKSFKRSLLLKPCLFFILGLLPFLLLLLVVRKSYPGAVTAYNKTLEISSYQDLFLPYISSFDLSFLFIQGDTTLYHSTGKHGVYLLATLPLFLIGCYQVIKNKKPIFLLILAAFIFAPLLFGLVGSIHRGSRLLATLPLFAIISSIGVASLFKIKTFQIKLILLAVTFLLFSLNYADFIDDYWTRYPDRAKVVFDDAAHIIFSSLNSYARENHKTPVLHRDIYRREGRGAKFFEQIYFPNRLKTWEGSEPIPENSVILSYSTDKIKLEQNGYRQLTLENPKYSLFTKIPY